MSYLDIAKTLATQYDKNEVLSTNEQRKPGVSTKSTNSSPPCPVDELNAFIAGLPAVDTWNLDETVARIRQLSHDERMVFFSALTHDWTAWKLAMAPDDEPIGGAS
jgi:hypothetical protein